MSPFDQNRNVPLIGPPKGGQIGADRDEQERVGKGGGAGTGAKQATAVGGRSLLMRVSYRQAKRLWKRYREEGAAGLQHRSTGRVSNHAHELKFRRKVLQLVREKYGGAVGERFGPTLAAEHLASEDGLALTRAKNPAGRKHDVHYSPATPHKALV